MTYSQKLRDPRWQKKRLEVMERDQFTCRTCKSTTETLTVHHINYRKGAEPWEYEASNLVCLCDRCHSVLEKDLIPMMRNLAVLHDPDTLVDVVTHLLHAVQDDSLPYLKSNCRAIVILNGAARKAKLEAIFGVLDDSKLIRQDAEFGDRVSFGMEVEDLLL